MHPFLTSLSAALPRTGFWQAPAVVAVSGGADSVALLVGLVRLAPPAARLVVAHARHDVRPEAGEDRRFVSELASCLGLPCESRPLAVRDDPEGRGEGMEARARRLRYEFFTDVAYAHGARHVVVGHTADDQAETILHRALRGTGLAGLAGMQPSRALAEGVALLRPMLALPRSLGREFLEVERTSWREDGVAAALDAAAAALLDIHARRQADGTIIIDAGPLAALEGPLLGHVLVALWSREGWPRRHMSARHYDSLARLVVAAGRNDGTAQAALDLPAGVRARVVVGRRIELAPRALVAAAGQ